MVLPYSKKGFSLVELLITISVIAITAGIAIPNLKKLTLDQELTTASQALIQNLKQAQSNAQSGVKCPDNQNSLSWKVDFGSNFYRLQCVNNSEGIISKSNVTLNSIILSSYCEKNGVITTSPVNPITFNSITYGGATLIACSARENFTVEMTKSSQKTYVKVTTGGVIYETATGP